MVDVYAIAGPTGHVATTTARCARWQQRGPIVNVLNGQRRAERAAIQVSHLQMEVRWIWRQCERRATARLERGAVND